MAEFKYIDVQKSRDLGQILNVTFSFIGQNFKNLGKAILYIGGIPLLIALLYSALVQWDASFQFGTPGGNFGHFISTFFVSLVLHLVAYIFITVVPIIYMKIYVEKKSNQISVTEVWNHSSGLFLKIFLAELGVGIITGFATLLLIIPGIYVAIAFSLMPVIIAIEDSSFSEALGRSSNLISGYWWFTFGLIFVISILQWVLSFILQFPLTALTIAIPFISKGGEEMLSNSFWLFRLFTGLSELSSFFYAFYTVALTFHYYNLVEKKEATGLLDKIEALNDPEPNTVQES